MHSAPQAQVQQLPYAPRRSQGAVDQSLKDPNKIILSWKHGDQKRAFRCRSGFSRLFGVLTKLQRYSEGGCEERVLTAHLQLNNDNSG
jgi:hypothetical protein